MDLNEILAENIKNQIGSLTFQVLLKDAQIALLNEENNTLKIALRKLAPEKKEDSNGIRP